VLIAKPGEAFTEEEYDKVFNINTKGTFFGISEAAKVIRNGGRIINISSGLTTAGGSYMSVYAASKGAVEQFTKCFADELGPKGVTVNTVSPGYTETEMLPPSLIENAIKLSPFKRLGTPQDIADAVAFLVSEKARWITGQNIQVGGGVVKP